MAALVRESNMQLLMYSLHICVSQSIFCMDFQISEGLCQGPEFSPNYTIDYLVDYIIIT